MINKMSLLCIVSGILAVPATVMSCVMCFQAQLWYLYPPLSNWGFIGFFWFITLVILQNFFGNRIPDFPRSILSPLLWLITATLLGATMMGSLPFLILLLFCINATFITFKHSPPELGRASRFFVYLAGIIYTSIIAGTIISETVNPTPLDPVSIIIQAPGSGLQSDKIGELKLQKPFPVESFRKIIQQADALTVSVVARPLLENSDLETEVPLIIDALERFEKARNNGSSRSSIESVLSSYTNIELPENSPAKKWRRAWEAQQSTHNSSGQQP